MFRTVASRAIRSKQIFQHKPQVSQLQISQTCAVGVRWSSSTSPLKDAAATVAAAATSATKKSSDTLNAAEVVQKEKIPVSFEDISRAHYRIKSGLRYTHCDKSQYMSDICNCEVYLKKDFTQYSGSFKERGARNALMMLSPEDKKKGVITASAGNHALALSWHGKDLGIPVRCVMPVNAPITKVGNCRKFGASVMLHGEHIGEAREFAMKEFPDVKYINGYDDREIIAGAGTMGIEILEQVSDVDAILVPIGGAGLIAGVALAAKTLKPNIEIIGVEPENVASYAAAIKAGYPVNGYKAGTLADGLAVPIVGPTSFAVAKHFVDYTVNVSEKMIAMAVLKLIEMDKLVVEGGGAAALAAVLPEGPLYNKFKGKRIVIPLCGGNIDTTVLGRVIDRGLAASKRLIRFSATVSDRPGGIAELARHMADVGVSVKDIYHERAWLHSRIDQVMIKCVVETTGEEHCEQLFKLLESKGYPLVKE